MRQILQNLGTGETLLADVPSPGVITQGFLVQTTRSLISIGTERMLVSFGKANLIEKARRQPDKVKQVLEKIRTDGLLATYDAVKSKMDQPIALGYSAVGTVVEGGTHRDGIKNGDRVVTNGPHAERVAVPRNLAAKVPEGVSDEAAAFTVVGAIGLQGVRLLAPAIGEKIVVSGLGLIGLLAVQILRANGCRVMGIDPDERRCELARQLGAEEQVALSRGRDPREAAAEFSEGRGMDGVLITASTASDEPVHTAAEMCRKRGRIVLVGVTGLRLRRDDFYRKELRFQVSCSYGPGRYDDQYEVKGVDYPYPFVRWTARRNFEAVLDLIRTGAVKTGPLISQRLPLEKALEAYSKVEGSEALGIVLKYPAGEKPRDEAKRSLRLQPVHRGDRPRLDPGGAVVGAIGAGNYASRVLLPLFGKSEARLKAIVSAGGVSGTHHGRKLGFELSSTKAGDVLADDEINTVVIATRHDSHAGFVLESLKQGKHVFVEKPLCLTLAELERIERYFNREEASEPRENPLLMVGFNRRFAPLSIAMKAMLEGLAAAKSLVITVNAGAIPREHWTQDRQAGGGRILGEACHFIDLARFLVGRRIREAQLWRLGGRGGGPGDVATIQLGFEDGSIAAIHYFANGHRAFPKERIEVFTSGRILRLDNFRTLTGYGWPGFKRQRSWVQDKGHKNEVETFLRAVGQGGPPPIPLDEIFEVSRRAIDLADNPVS